MKTSIQTNSLQLAGLALFLAVLPPVSVADEPATAASQAGIKAADKTAEKIRDYKTDQSELSKAEVKSAMAQIDAELEHLDKLADAAPTAQQRAETKARYDVLNDRRNDLKKDFTRARYEAFKADLRAEMNKVSAWAKETFTTKPAANSAANSASSAADEASRKLEAYRTDSSDLNKAEVKASLSHLDADIDLLAVKIDAISDPVRKSEMKRRLDAYKERRKELNSQFRRDRYDALLADVKAEWNQLVN